MVRSFLVFAVAASDAVLLRHDLDSYSDMIASHSSVRAPTTRESVESPVGQNGYLPSCDLTICPYVHSDRFRGVRCVQRFIRIVYPCYEFYVGAHHVLTCQGLHGVEQERRRDVDRGTSCEQGWRLNRYRRWRELTRHGSAGIRGMYMVGCL